MEIILALAFALGVVWFVAYRLKRKHFRRKKEKRQLSGT